MSDELFQSETDIEKTPPTMTIDKVVTIDGLAASGKSSVSRMLAAKLGWEWVSTGAFYRTIGLLCIRKDVNFENEEQVLAAFKNEDWKIVKHPERTQVMIDGKDVTEQIYQENVGTAASNISVHTKIRKAILQAQRDCLTPKGLVAEGRDCGSVIFPSAGLKVFLVADPVKRAQRRAIQEGLDPSEVLQVQKARDEQDSIRIEAPTVAPEGSVIIDTSEHSLEEVVDKIYALAQKKFDITP